MLDPLFRRDGLAPDNADFTVCRGMVRFLVKFKAKTHLVSASSKPLAHRFFPEICDVYQHIREWASKPQFCLIGDDMKSKYDKYWGNLRNLNDYMYFGVLLDPRMKFKLLRHAFGKLVSDTTTKDNPMTSVEISLAVESLIGDIEKRFENFFNFHKEKIENADGNVSFQDRGSNEDAIFVDEDNDFLGEYFSQTDNSSSSKDTEWRIYLNDPIAQNNKEFDILGWWKLNEARYPIVSRMAKGITLIIYIVLIVFVIV